jgi:translation initiation factor 1
MCPVCGQPLARCTCKATAAAQAIRPTDGVARVQREIKGRGGKSVTLVKGVALAGAPLAALGKQLKAACGSGGTVKDGVIEVQGDHVQVVMALLQKLGYAVKRVGG